jgi:hypothetical protein
MMLWTEKNRLLRITVCAREGSGTLATHSPFANLKALLDGKKAT